MIVAKNPKNWQHRLLKSMEICQFYGVEILLNPTRIKWLSCKKKMSNVSKKVQCKAQIPSTIKNFFDGNINEFLHWHSVRMKDGEVVFIMKSIVCHEPSKDIMGWFEDENLTVHCPKVIIVFKVEFQTSFWHSKITFFKKLWTNKSWDINLTFIFKKIRLSLCVSKKKL